MFPLFCTWCLLVADALFAVVVSFVASAVSGGCCFARHPALLTFQLYPTTRILYKFCCMTFPNSSTMATKYILERLSLFTKLPVDLYPHFVKNGTLSPSCTLLPYRFSLCDGSILYVEDAVVAILLILSLISASLICSCCNYFDIDSILLFFFHISIKFKNVINDRLGTYIPTWRDQEHYEILWSPSTKNNIRPWMPIWTS